jgi:hypothetical protein
MGRWLDTGDGFCRFLGLIEGLASAAGESLRLNPAIVTHYERSFESHTFSKLCH